MAILGSLIILAVAAAFLVMSALMLWGGLQTLREELLRGFVSASPPAGERALTLALVCLPLAAASCFGLLSAAWMVLVVFT